MQYGPSVGNGTVVFIQEHGVIREGDLAVIKCSGCCNEGPGGGAPGAKQTQPAKPKKAKATSEGKQQQQKTKEARRQQQQQQQQGGSGKGKQASSGKGLHLSPLEELAKAKKAKGSGGAACGWNGEKGVQAAIPNGFASLEEAAKAKKEISAKLTWQKESQRRKESTFDWEDSEIENDIENETADNDDNGGGDDEGDKGDEEKEEEVFEAGDAVQLYWEDDDTWHKGYVRKRSPPDKISGAVYYEVEFTGPPKVCNTLDAGFCLCALSHVLCLLCLC
jgi:hypothetical protein